MKAIIPICVSVSFLDYEKMTKSLELIEKCEKVLSNAQRKFPETKEYDSICDNISKIRGEIQELLSMDTDGKYIESGARPLGE
jgi:hypothetical protein